MTRVLVATDHSDIQIPAFLPEWVLVLVMVVALAWVFLYVLGVIGAASVTADTGIARNEPPTQCSFRACPHPGIHEVIVARDLGAETRQVCVGHHNEGLRKKWWHR